MKQSVAGSQEERFGYSIGSLGVSLDKRFVAQRCLPLTHSLRQFSIELSQTERSPTMSAQEPISIYVLHKPHIWTFQEAGDSANPPAYMLSDHPILASNLNINPQLGG